MAVIKVLPDPFNITIYTIKKSKNFHCYFRWEGNTYRFSLKTNNIHKAASVATFHWHSIRRGGVSPSLSFSKLCDNFLEERSKRLKSRTITNYKHNINILKKYFSDIHKIDKKSLSLFEKWRYENYPKTGLTILNQEISLLLTILRFGSDFHNLDIKIPKWQKYKILSEKDIPSVEEHQAILDILRPHPRLIIEFISATGIRYPSEVNKLRWDDINLDNKTMIIRDRKSKKGEDDVLPLFGKGLEILQQLNRNGNEYVFRQRDNGKQINSIRVSLYNAVKKLGIKKKLSMYSFRHYFCSRFIIEKPHISHSVLAKLMGHNSIQQIEKTYKHLLLSDLHKILK